MIHTLFSLCFLLPAAPAGVRVQHAAPNFKEMAVVDGQFKELKLEDFRGQYLVLFFYPLDLWVEIE